MIKKFEDFLLESWNDEEMKQAENDGAYVEDTSLDADQEDYPNVEDDWKEYINTEDNLEEEEETEEE